MKKLISFDLDQTLVNSIEAHVLAFQLAFKELGYKIKTKKIKPFIDGRPSSEVIKTMIRNLDEKQIEKIRELHHKFLHKTMKYAKSIPQALKTLKKLKINYKLVIVTNCTKEEANLMLKASKLPRKLFDFIILAEKIKPKPWPDEIFKAEKLEHSKSDIHVGDSIYDILAAKKARVINISVLTGQASRKKLEKYTPDFIIKSVAYLPKILEKIEN